MKTARGLIWAWMKLWGFYGFTSLSGEVYALPGYETSATLKRHEDCHVMQRTRDGKFVWPIKTLWYILRYGYQNSPYEVEARAAETVI